MGDAQSAQREGKKDAAAEEETGQVDEDARTEPHIEQKPLKNVGIVSEMNGKADGSLVEVNGHCEDEVAAQGLADLPQDEDVSEKPLKDAETPLGTVDIIEKKPPNEAEEDVSSEVTKMEEKENEINDTFRNFFTNIGLKLTVKRGSVKPPEIATNEDIPSRPEVVEDTSKGTESEANIAQESNDNDSTTCPTITDVTSEGGVEHAEAEEAAADTTTTSLEGENLDASPEKEPPPASPSSQDQEVVASPIKRFFKTGIFSGLRKKKKPIENETTEKELVDMGKQEAVEATEQPEEDRQQQKEEVSPGVTAAVEKENTIQEKTLLAASAQTTSAPEVRQLEEKSPSTDQSTNFVSEPEILRSQEKDKVHASPLRRLLSGSSLRKLSKKQRSRKSSDANLSDSGEHVSDHLLSSTESAVHQKEEGPSQPSVEVTGEEDGAWASFKKRVTPKKRVKTSSLSNEETQIPGSLDEPKQSEGEQISDHSTEEGKKKDSSVSWEAVLCGSGRRRSRKTSDSEEGTPQIENDSTKRTGESKHDEELSKESSNEVEEILASSPKQDGSPPELDGGSTWKSFKRLVTPKRKAKDEEESKYDLSSDTEVTQDESSFSIKKLLPGRKKRKSAEKQDQVSSDEADKDDASDDDSETPAVVPLSEFDTVETDVIIQTQADVESHVPGEADLELQQDLLDQITEPTLPSDNLQTEGKKVQDDDILENQASAPSSTNEELDDLAELISKHQQLSDIPEEGAFTETMATPASVIEEAARDDTIAEDLIEITSEAFTAPEPADITLTDETEMISAVSEFSESSKTSGNTTPVPAEYNIGETEVLLQLVAETICTTPKDVPLCSDEPSCEEIVGSVSHQILETSVAEEPKILEIHRSDATANCFVVNTTLHVEELDAVNNLAATAQTESLSEVNEAVSTEMVSEIHTEEFDTANTAVDEVHEVNVSHLQDNIKESQHLVECLTEVNKVMSAEVLPESKEISTDDGAIETPKMDFQDADSAATVEGKTEDADVEQDVKLLSETVDENVQGITDQVEDHSNVVVVALQGLTANKEDTTGAQEGSVQSFEKEAISEAISEDETVKDEPKEETAPLTDISVETDSKDTDVEDVTVNSEEGSVQPLEIKVKSEDVPETFTQDEPKEPRIEVSLDPENIELTPSEIAQHEVAEILDSEECSVQPVEKEVASEDVPDAGTEGHRTEDNVETETDLVQEPLETEEEREFKSVQTPKKDEISDGILAEETITDTHKEATEEELPPEAATTEQELVPCDAEAEGQVVTGSEGNAHELDKLSKDIPKPEAENVTASVAEETASQLNPASEKQNDPNATVDVPQDVQVDEEVRTLEVADDLQTLTPVHVPSVNEETKSVQVLPVVPEETPVSCADLATTTQEPKHEVHVSVVQVTGEMEKEGELPSVAVEHSVVEQVTTSNVKDVSAAIIPDVPMEQTPDILEPSIDSEVSGLDFQETTEVPTPVIKDTETAVMANVVVMMHMPAVELEDNHRISVPVVGVDTRSAETVGEVIQLVKTTLPETSPESGLVNKEEEVIQEEIVAQVESERSDVADERVPEDDPGTLNERPDEGLAGIDSQAIMAEQKASEDVMQTPEVPDVPVDDSKEGLEEKKDDKKESDVCVVAAEKVSIDTVEGPPVAQIQTITPGTTGLLVPQNMGVISSIGNVESPSSLSLEFKLNIQFGQAKAPASPPPAPTERVELKQTDVSEVQAEAAAEPSRPINPVERHKETEVDVPAEPATRSHSTVFINPPVVLDVGITALETVEQLEEVKLPESVIQVQAADTTQPMKTTEVLMCQQVVSEASEQEQRTEEPIKETEEEYDQDVWMDAEETICTQEDTAVVCLEKSLESETQQEEKSVLEDDFEIAPSSKAEGEPEMNNTDGTCEIDSEGDDFAVALDRPEDATASIPTVDWD